MGLGGGGAALNQGRVVDATDLDHAVRGVNAHQGERSHSTVGLAVHHGKEQRVAARLSLFQVGEKCLVLGKRLLKKVGPGAVVGCRGIGREQIGSVKLGVDGFQAA